MSNWTVVTLLALFIILLAIAEASAQDTMLLCWEPPTENEDGTPLAEADIQSYRIFTVNQGDVEFHTAVAGTVNCVNLDDACYALKTRDTQDVDSTYYSVAVCADGGSCHIDP